MKQKRKVTICLVCLVWLVCLAAALTACGSDGNGSAPAQTEAPETSSVMAETAEDSEAAAEESSSDETAAEADSLAEAETEEPEDPTKIEGGASVDEALTILPNTRYTGTYREGEQWFAFTTGDKEDVPYVITVDNLTVGSDALLGYLCGEDGTWVEPTRRANNNDRNRAVQADAGGGANSGMFNTLLPGTTYYLRITGGKKADFSLRITDPNETMFDVAEGRKTISAGDALEVATNMDAAPLLKFNTRYEGKYTEGNQWFAFTTGDKEGVPYVITVDNLTAGSDSILGYVCDEYGTWIEPTRRANNNDRNRAVQAGGGGDANSGMFDTLKPDTTYFLRLNADKKAEYSLRITDPNETPFDAAEGRTTISAGDALEAATNMDAAPLLKFNTPYEGKYTDGNQWFAFTTGDGEDVPYVITVENRTIGSDSILGYVCDEYGTWIEPTKRANNNDRNRAVQAGQDGAPNSGMFDTLKPNTTYFLRLNAGKKAEYIVTISDPSDTGTDPTDENGEEPGTSSSAALNVPLGTKVYGRYNEGYLWFAFTTTEVEDAEYYVTVINCTPGSDSLLGYVCDKYGTWVEPTQRANNNDRNRAVQAAWDGSANSGMFNKLQPNTTYYIRMNGGTKADYSLAVYAPGQTSNAYSTSANLTEAKGSLDEGQTLYTGTNQNAATPLKNNVTYHGDYEEGYAWVSFTTDEREDAEYRITVENLTAGSANILGYVCNLYGRWLEPAERANNNERTRAIQAGEDGTPNTCMFNTLEPDTTYYIRLNCGTKAEYLITIDAPLPEESGNTIEEAAVEETEEEPAEAPEEVVFEVPFELNETQVRFKAESDQFIDPAAVQEALAPVAEIILEYPEHPILLAGTTATDGDQAKRVELSERRAAAVKKVLVESFNVPEEQLLTIGLGFEADPFERGRDRDSNGKFIETEGAKNRRVIVMDAETPVAREILGTAE